MALFAAESEILGDERDDSLSGAALDAERLCAKLALYYLFDFFSTLRA